MDRRDFLISSAFAVVAGKLVAGEKTQFEKNFEQELFSPSPIYQVQSPISVSEVAVPGNWFRECRKDLLETAIEVLEDDLQVLLDSPRLSLPLVTIQNWQRLFDDVFKDHSQVIIMGAKGKNLEYPVICFTGVTVNHIGFGGPKVLVRSSQSVLHRGRLTAGSEPRALLRSKKPILCSDMQFLDCDEHCLILRNPQHFRSSDGRRIAECGTPLSWKGRPFKSFRKEHSRFEGGS